MTTFTRKLLGALPVVLVATLISACGSDEPAATDDHTPTTYTVVINELPATSPYNFTVGQTVRVRLRLFNVAGENLDDVEAEHFAAISFNPSDLVTFTRVPGHNYQFDVTGNTAGTGTMLVTFGHDEQADEVTLDPSAVAVAGTGGPN
ncbi:MAG TPA: hypothetical protein VFX42_11160 [Gemmatimonadales bacterium]|nr:hypothetical protein [Gemmatimonadales bacterium]